MMKLEKSHQITIVSPQTTTKLVFSRQIPFNYIQFSRYLADIEHKRDEFDSQSLIQVLYHQKWKQVFSQTYFRESVVVQLVS